MAIIRQRDGMLIRYRGSVTRISDAELNGPNAETILRTRVEAKENARPVGKRRVPTVRVGTNAFGRKTIGLFPPGHAVPSNWPDRPELLTNAEIATQLRSQRG